MKRFIKPKVNLNALSKSKIAEPVVTTVVESAVKCLKRFEPASPDRPASPKKRCLEADILLSPTVVPTTPSLLQKTGQLCNTSPMKNIHMDNCEIKPQRSVSLTDIDMDTQQPIIESNVSKFNEEEEKLEPNRINLFAEKKRDTIRRIPYKPTIKKDEPLDKSSVVVRDLIYWVPTHNPPPKYRQDREEKKPVSRRPSGVLEPPAPDINTLQKSMTTEVNFAAEEDTAGFAQVKIDADGNIVLDEASLVVRSKQNTLGLRDTCIYEDADHITTNCRSYLDKCRGRTKRWNEREVIHFYKALSTIGTDFSSMSRMFKSRDREDLKKKFKREEKRNPHLIDRALKSRRRYDLSVFNISSSEDENVEADNPVPELSKKKCVTKQPRKPAKKRFKNKKLVFADDSDDENSPANQKPARRSCIDRMAAEKRVQESIDSVLSGLNHGSLQEETLRSQAVVVKDLIQLSRKRVATQDAVKPKHEDEYSSVYDTSVSELVL